MKSNRVYSTEEGRICRSCNKPVAHCGCKQNQQASSASKGDGIVRIRRETKGRKGAGVSIIDGLAVDEKNLKQLAKKIKQACSSGGSIKAGSVEIQGDHREKIKTLLEKEGFTVKLSGG